MIEELLSRHPEMLNELLREYENRAFEDPETIPDDMGGLKHPVTGARKKSPKPGDAPPWSAIDASQKRNIRDLIEQLGKEEACYRDRMDPAHFIRVEWAQFNRRFNLSAHDHLPKTQFEDAIKHLSQKLLAKRTTEAKFGKIDRERKGIFVIARSLGWTVEERRSFCSYVIGKRRLGLMSPQEIHMVYVAMLRRQDADKAA
jgi:hypothetical protein